MPVRIDRSGAPLRTKGFNEMPLKPAPTNGFHCEVIARCARPMKKAPRRAPFGFGGEEGDRTLDLRIANATLSQLSYFPESMKILAKIGGRSCRAVLLMRL